MITTQHVAVRPATVAASPGNPRAHHAARGRTRIGWLDSAHTFSFGRYQDPDHMGFRSLRVINDDRVAPGMGFDTHGHRDMEIISWVLEGGLAHKDSLGHAQTLRPGDIQVMTAGRGIRHSEYNPSAEEPVHFLQIWITPDRAGHDPAYEDRHVPAETRRNRLALVAAPAGTDHDQVDHPLPIHQDARVYVADLATGASVSHTLAESRGLWVHVASGEVEVAGQNYREGDGIAVSSPGTLAITAQADGQVLLFDLA